MRVICLLVNPHRKYTAPEFMILKYMDLKREDAALYKQVSLGKVEWEG